MDLLVMVIKIGYQNYNLYIETQFDEIDYTKIKIIKNYEAIYNR